MREPYRSTVDPNNPDARTKLINAIGAFRDLDFRPIQLPNLPRTPVVKSIWETQAEMAWLGLKKEIEALQNSLQPDEELFMYYASPLEVIRITTLRLASNNLIALCGKDPAGNDGVVLVHLQAVSFVCKVVRAPQKPNRIGFVGP